MTKKDYKLIALVIFNLKFDGDESVRDYVAEEFANALAQTNTRFDRAKFLAACGVG